MRKANIDFSHYAMAAAALGSVTAASSAKAAFIGPYALNPPPNGTYSNAQVDSDIFGDWTSTLTFIPVNSTMSLTTNQPVSVQLSSFNLQVGSPTDNFDLTTAAKAGGTVQFNWAFSSISSFGQFAFGYLVNGTFTQLATASQSSSTSFAVSAGDIFGFRLSGNYGTNGNVTISNFSAPVPEPSVGMLAALGAVGLLTLRAVRRQKLA